MGFITAAVAVAGVAAATSAAQAVAKKKAADKAGKAREDALNGLKMLDIPAINEDAAKADEASYKGRLDLQKRADPLSAEARSAGLQGLIDNVNSPNDAKSLSIIDRLSSDAEDPAMADLQRRLVDDARASLAAGASLPPEFQAELVRTGLEGANRAGLAPDRAGAAGTTLRRLTGSAGLALEEQRKAQATRSAGAAQSLAQTKASILGNLIPQIQSITGQKTQRAAVAFEAGASQTPKAYGLDGADVAGLNVANNKLENAKTIGIGEVRAGRATAQGELTGAAIGAAGDLATSGMGAYAKANPNSWLAKWGAGA